MEAIEAPTPPAPTTRIFMIFPALRTQVV